MLKKIDELPFVNERNALALMIAMHTAGIIGLAFEESRAMFQMLTPFNLVATAAILLHFEKEKSSRYFAFIIVTFIFGFGFEVIGVKTGVIFGEYAYGETLGLKMLDVPLVIGLNWVILIYMTRAAATKFFKSEVLIILFSSLMMVVLDLLIEPVAIRFDFWQWEANHIPLQNYIGWFALSVLIQFIGIRIFPISNNRLNTNLLIVQFMFFLLLNLF